MKRIFILIAVLLAPAAAGAVTLNADADAFIRDGLQVNSSNGLGDTLVVANGPSVIGNPTFDSGDFKTYIRFDLSGVSGTISNAQLDLTFAGTNSVSVPSLGYFILGLPDALGDNWNESTISYSTAPGTTPGDYYSTPGFEDMGIMAFDPAAVIAGDVVSHSSTALDFWLNNLRGADDLVTIVIIAAVEGTGYHPWASRENLTYSGPILSFDVSNGPGGPGPGVVPLPAAGWLLLAALGAMAAKRRKQA